MFFIQSMLHMLRSRSWNSGYRDHFVESQNSTIEVNQMKYIKNPTLI